MGLLDSLFAQSTYSGQGGGLLDMLHSFQQQQYQPSAGFDPQTSGRSFDAPVFDPATYAPNQAQPISVGGYQMPRIGDASQFQSSAQLPQNSQPTHGQTPIGVPPMQPQQPTQQIVSPPPTFVGVQQPTPQQQLPPAFGGGSPLGRMFNPDGLIARLTGNDSRSIAQQNLKAQYDALVPMLGPQKAMLAVMNPQAGKLILDDAFGKDKYTPVKTKDMMGNETVGAFNANDGTYKSIPAAGGGTGATNMLGDMSKTGPEYLATVPKQQQGILQGMVDGTIQPPSSFALAKPYWQAMLAGAKNLDPNFDANTWATRHKMSTDIAGSGNSSIGGILSNGKSAFAHLAELSGSMADLGNTSHNFPGGSAAAAAQNYLGNKVFAGSDTAAKIKAINDNLGHFGQESTKFYSGTGGGVEERMNALKEMNPVTTSSAEMAAYLGKEKGLMLDRLRQKEAQIRDTMGETFLQKHPVFTPQLQETISRIDANIAKLSGDQSASSQIQAKPQTVIQNGHSYTLQPDGSYK